MKEKLELSSFSLQPLDMKAWDDLVVKSYQFKKQIGLNSDKEYKNLLQEYLKKLKSGKFKLNEVETEKGASVVIQLWLSNSEFYEKILLTEENLNFILEKLENTNSKLLIIDLVELYFKYYDSLGNAGYYLIKFILKHQKLLRGEKILKQIKKLLDDEYKSHKIPVNEAIDNNDTLVHVLTQNGLYQISNGKFLNRCRYYMYIRRAEVEEIQDIGRILKEIENNKIYLAEYLKDDDEKEKNYLIGHKIIEILLTKLEKVYADIKNYQPILNFILAIAGDPRSSNSTDSFVKWWNILGAENIAKMKKYLSSFDLNMFLETYENYITNNGYENERRMFVERKNFLRGMLEENLIHETKLFVGSDMEYYLKETYKNDTIKPTYYSISDNARMCVIFMKFNNYIMTEGAFNCTFRMYANAEEIKVFFAKRKDYTYREIGKGLEESQEVITVQIHNGNWQNKVLNVFRNHCKYKINHRLFYDRRLFGGF